MTQNVGKSEDTILTVMDRYNVEMERRKDGYLLSVFCGSLGPLVLFSYLVPTTCSNVGVIIPILYTKELWMNKFSDLAEVLKNEIQTLFSVGQTLFLVTFQCFKMEDTTDYIDKTRENER